MRTTMKLLPLILAGGLLVAACGNDDSTSTKAGATTTTAAGSPSGSASTATVSVTSGHLVGPNGHTLYLFEKDKGTTTACTGGCAGAWPALVATGTPSAGSGVDGGKLSTADGEQPNQVVYNGHLLYYFSGDQAAGDTNGTSVPSWYAVDGGGKAIEDAGAGTTSTTASASGY
jgi:predicted lipoprotein with Yx(FWY)xxD motif